MKSSGIKICFVVMLFLLCSCGGASSKTLDIDVFAKNTVAQVDFGDELILLSDNIASDYYDLSFAGLEQYAIYVSSTSATASELAVFKCKDNTALNAAKLAVETRIADQVSNYENYRPDEKFRLENALVEAKDNYLLFAVSNDNSAIQKLFNEQLK